MYSDDIKNIFSCLTAEEQSVLIIELTKIQKPLEANMNEIIEFAQKHQKEFKEDISFTVSITDNGLIEAVLSTSYAKYKGYGKNQKLAKIDAIRKAEKDFQ